MQIKEAVEFIVAVENLRTAGDLDRWCGDMGNKKIYAYVQNLAPEHWQRIRTPENSVRFYYQKILRGYKICRI
jgi:hypothetical protein